MRGSLLLPASAASWLQPTGSSSRLPPVSTAPSCCLHAASPLLPPMYAALFSCPRVWLPATAPRTQPHAAAPEHRSLLPPALLHTRVCGPSSFMGVQLPATACMCASPVACLCCCPRAQLPAAACVRGCKLLPMCAAAGCNPRAQHPAAARVDSSLMLPSFTPCCGSRAKLPAAACACSSSCNPRTQHPVAVCLGSSQLLSACAAP